MTYYEDYYILTLLSTNNTITLQAKELPNPTTDIINLYIYDYKDKYRINLIDSLSVESGQTGILTITNDGIYRIIISITCNGEECSQIQLYYNTKEYIYKFNGTIFNVILQQLIKWLCKCKTCLEQNNSKCFQCNDTDRCHNKFIFNYSLDALITTILNEDESSKWTEFVEYTSRDKYTYIVKQIQEAYNKGFVKGQYEIAESLIEYYWFIVYTYLMMRYSFYSTNYITCIDDVVSCLEDRFEFTKVLMCATDKGIDLYKMINDYADTIDSGYIGFVTENMCTNIDDCEYLQAIINGEVDGQGQWYKRKEVNDKWIEVQYYSNEPQKLVIIVPATWGKLINIDADNTINILNEFDKFKIGNYLAYISQNTYFNTDVNIKLTFKI